MPTEVVMPKLGLNMSEGTIVEWLKKEGDRVSQGDLLFVVETDKITTESEASVAGVLAKILVGEGEEVPVRTPVAIIVAEGETLTERVEAAPATEHQKANLSPEMKPDRLSSQERSSGKILASPAAKRLARDRNLDLGNIPGTGRFGSIRRVDVELFLNSQKPAPPGKILASPVAKRLAKAHGIDLVTIVARGRGGRISQDDVQRVIDERAIESQTSMEEKLPSEDALIPIEGVRSTIAERMSQSQQQTAQVTLHTEVDATSLVNRRQAYKRASASAGTNVPSYNALLMTLVAQALSEHPRMNARKQGAAIRLLQEINVGLAVDTDRGLLVVVVRDADQKSVLAIESELVALSERARLETSTLKDLSDGTFTITNLGAFGIDRFTPIINPPEMGILGVGRIIEMPAMVNGTVQGQPRITLSLTFDHRFIDGGPAAKFLQHIAQLIETV